MATAIILGDVELVDIAAGWLEPEGGARIWVPAFAIGRYPATNADWAVYLEASGAAAPPWWEHPDFRDPEQPVVGVSWHEALAYCHWLSEHEGRSYTLPREAQWEYAARGGWRTCFPWGDAHPGTGRPARPPRVKDGRPNALGLYALSGVCHEWCLDGDDTRRASRGGAWRHHDPWTPIGGRSSLPPALRYSDYGFRVISACVSGSGH